MKKLGLLIIVLFLAGISFYAFAKEVKPASIEDQTHSKQVGFCSTSSHKQGKLSSVAKTQGDIRGLKKSGKAGEVSKEKH